MLDDPPCNFKEDAVLPVSNDLFNTQDDADKLNKGSVLLSPCVQGLVMDNLKKIRQTMKYNCITSDLQLTLRTNGLGSSRWWVSTTFSVPHNMWSHTGDFLCQGNQSTLKLEKNGKGSIGKKAQHINIRYLFATDCIVSNEMSVEYYPTNMMLDDFYTKPLQGKLIYLSRERISNVQDGACNVALQETKKNTTKKESAVEVQKNSPVQECVGQNANQKPNGDFS
eukprot:12491488-Ditylum_brightwellii.AAC.1